MAALAMAEKRRSRTAGELVADLTGTQRPPPPPPTLRDLRPLEFIVSDGDPRPPHVRLRMTLEAARAEGKMFRAVWREAVDDAVRGIGEKRERELWTNALWQTLDEWESAFHRVGPRLKVFDNLLMGIDD